MQEMVKNIRKNKYIIRKIKEKQKNINIFAKRRDK